MHPPQLEMHTEFAHTHTHNRIHVLSKHALTHSKMSPILHYSDHILLAFIRNAMSARTHTHNVITHSLAHFSFVWLSEQSKNQLQCDNWIHWNFIVYIALHGIEIVWDWHATAMHCMLPSSLPFFSSLPFSCFKVKIRRCLYRTTHDMVSRKWRKMLAAAAATATFLDAAPFLATSFICAPTNERTNEQTIKITSNNM